MIQQLITENKLLNSLKLNYDLEGTLSKLDGEVDFNYKFTTFNNKNYLLKISRIKYDIEYINFQYLILNHIKQKGLIKTSEVVKNRKNELYTEIKDEKGNVRILRLLSWIEGDLWSNYQPHKNNLLHSLGIRCALTVKSLQDFSHPLMYRNLKWDLMQAKWIKNHFVLFNNQQLEIVNYYYDLFRKVFPELNKLRKSCIHNDANDNNLILKQNKTAAEVKTLIDFGDAVYSLTINELVVAITYAIMNKTDPLSAALPVIKGFHENFNITLDEIKHLYLLIAMRLLVSATISAINEKREPENQYHQISRKPAWDLLHKWIKIPEHFAYLRFANTCGLYSNINKKLFIEHFANNHLQITDLFRKNKFQDVEIINTGINSKVVKPEFMGNDSLKYQLKKNKISYKKLQIGAYSEARLVGNQSWIKQNEGKSYKSIFLANDFYTADSTKVFNLFDGEVIYRKKNTLVIKSELRNSAEFFIRYGNINISKEIPLGRITKGELLGETLNTNYQNQIFFIQIIFNNNYEIVPVYCTPEEFELWDKICISPIIIFENNNDNNNIKPSELIDFRKKHLGKSLSLSYNQPLTILRGEMQYLINHTGQYYLDTVNNVAHVGHENPRVVRAGQQQMEILNTNTRYLHPNIINYAKELLKKLPKDLSVIHFVNSGSEANELAMRMARTYTGQKDMIAVEIGYHGNTSGCIDVSSYKFDGQGGKGAPEYTHIVPLPDSYRGIYKGTLSETGENYASHILKQLEKVKANGKGVAAFICEGIISCGGQIVLPDNYLKTAKKYLKQHNSLLIVDEVQTGFGRIGKHFWAFDLQDVVPDIVTMGKPIGNGHPLAAVACTQKVADAFANGMEYFNTFGGNPVSAAIGHEVLNVIKDENLQQNALDVGSYLKSELIKLSEKNQVIGDVRGEGLFLGFELIENKNKKPSKEKADYLVNRMKEKGILMSTDGPFHNVIKIKPPICFNKNNAEEVIEYLNSVFNENFMKINNKRC